MNTNLGNACLAVVTFVVMSACGGASDTPGAATGQAAKTSIEKPAGACGMLSRDQVATVIADNDGGQEQHASEGELIKGVLQEHCRYLHAEDTGVKWLDLLVYRASSDEGFEQIKIADWAHHGSSRRLDIGDIGYLHDMSDQNEMVATASKGKTVFELSLNADDAAAKSEQLIELARIVAGKI